jgi:alkanesulfonate monooxygenase SsuD/methylene tetrahydromethanopterin reductase-like flavin-dependent oxidoreductase (luciferase family)
MRFALSVPPFTEPATVLAWARSAEANGWDGFFLWDHLRWDDQVEVHDPWVLLGAIATATQRMRLGTMVTPVSRRRPATLAKHLVTLDHLSNGRVTLGVGLGDPPGLDFADFGDEPSYQVRAQITDEALDVLAGLLRGSVSHHGTHLHAEATMRPGPVQPHVPIWIAGRAPNRKPLERARRWDGYVPIAQDFLTPEQLADYIGPHPHDHWDVVAQWPEGSSPVDYEAAGATWLVRSVWPHESGWRDELEHLVSAPPS